jgi:hypothetical protein
MAQQTINRGTVENDHTGESPYSAFGKVNDNFAELYVAVAAKLDVIPSSTWAARGTATNGALKWITDHGPTPWLARGDGTYWVAVAPTLIGVDIVPATGPGDTTENALKVLTFQPGILRAGRLLRIWALGGKTNTSNAGSQNRLKIGTNGSPADTTLHSPTAMTSGQQSIPLNATFAITSATQLRRFGNQNATVADFSNAGVSTAYPVNVTIPDIDANTIYLSLCMQASNGASPVEGYHLAAELVS